MTRADGAVNRPGLFSRRTAIDPGGRRGRLAPAFDLCTLASSVSAGARGPGREGSRSAMPIQFAVLASGSRGNSTLVQAGHAGLLIDFGLGPRALAARLEGVGSGLGRIAAVVLTHTHGDHVHPATLRLLAARKIPLYCHEGHRAALADAPGVRRARRRGAGPPLRRPAVPLALGSPDRAGRRSATTAGRPSDSGSRGGPTGGPGRWPDGLHGRHRLLVRGDGRRDGRR